MGVTEFVASLFPTAYADAPKEEEQPEENKEEQAEGDEGGEDSGAEEEEEEPEDVHPALKEECQQGKCAQLTKHFEHCQEKVQAGEGFKGEDCVEELMMHCVDGCVAPKLFSKLR